MLGLVMPPEVRSSFIGPFLGQAVARSRPLILPERPGWSAATRGARRRPPAPRSRRSRRHPLGVAGAREGRGVDPTTPGGRRVVHRLGALAAFERDRIRERTAAGPAAARAGGRRGGGGAAA